jgi:gentisate 1,2-dioxygenase
MNQIPRKDSVALLDRDMAAKNLSGYWRLGMEGLPPDPVTTVQPCLWKWADVHEGLRRAGEVISLENSERRVVRLVNPGLNNRLAFATHTIQISFQYVKPGENARAHRHTPAALRFVVQGNGAYTTVNGQQCIMEPGDLILTPKLTWHDHSNESKEPMLWLDGLDFPLVTALHQVMQERYPERRQPIEKNSEDVVKPGVSLHDGVPSAEFVHYKWRDTEKTLRALADSPAAKDRFDGFLLEYRNPLTGGPTMTTIQCALQLLSPKHETESHRHTSTVIYHVFRGNGTTQIGERRFDWEQGDSFVVPLWYAHRHLNRSSSEDAILFSMSDAPVLKALDLYREEACR